MVKKGALMKKFFLIICFFSYAQGMQEDENNGLLLPAEMNAKVTAYVRIKDAQEHCFDCDEDPLLSINHTQIGHLEDALNEPYFSLLGWWNKETALLNVEYEDIGHDGGKKETFEYNISHGDDFQIDGVNDNGCIVMGKTINVVNPDAKDCDYISCYYLVGKDKARKNMHLCWCNPKRSYFERPDFKSNLFSGMLTAIALHKKTNRFAVVRNNKGIQCIEIYDATNIDDPTRISKHSSCINPMDRLKKISFITPRVLAALSVGGQFSIIGLDKDNIIIPAAQKIVDENEQAVSVKDLAVDASNPCQLVMLLNNGRLIYGDIKKHRYIVIAYSIKLDNLWYYDHRVAYAQSLSDTVKMVSTFDLVPLSFEEIRDELTMIKSREIKAGNN